MEQSTTTNIVSILSSDSNKIEKYKDLLKKVIPFAQSSKIQIEKKAAFDFSILLKSAINESNNSVLLYINDAIEHLIRYFMEDLIALIDQKVDWEFSYNSNYDFLHDLACIIIRTMLHKNKLEEFRQLCLQI